MYEEAKDVVNLGRSARCGCSEARGGGGGGGGCSGREQTFLPSFLSFSLSCLLLN